jgi:hypothetical protein
MVLIPSPSHFFCVDTHQPLNTTQFMGWEVGYTGEPYRVKPELCFQVIPMNVDVSRFAVLVRIKEEPVRSAPQDSGHERTMNRARGEPMQDRAIARRVAPSACRVRFDSSA